MHQPAKLVKCLLFFENNKVTLKFRYKYQFLSLVREPSISGVSILIEETNVPENTERTFLRIPVGNEIPVGWYNPIGYQIDNNITYAIYMTS